MDQFNLLFQSVAPDDVEGQKTKALVAAKFLRIFAIVAIVLTLIIAVPVLLAGSVLGGIGLSGAGASGGAAVAGGLFFAVIGVIVMLLALVGSFLTFWYAGDFPKKLASNQVPGLGLPYILMALTVLSVLGALRPFNLVSLLINGFVAYLWYVIITAIKSMNA